MKEGDHRSEGEDRREVSGDSPTEEVLLEYLTTREQENPPAADELLDRLPGELREECRERIETVVRVQEILSRMGGAAGAESPVPPQVPGFRIEQRIGRGGLGTVYAAWDETLERRVALKVLRRGTAAAVRARILTEARRAAGLRDPAIVTIHSIVEGDEASAIVMEHVEGFSIDRVAAGLTYRQRARLLQEVGRALAVAHENGIIHRDLKPDNVLVTPELEPRILDFGLAVSQAEARQSRGIFEGTPLYASPEQARGDPLTPASDVFSLGALMFTVLTGKAAFPGRTMEDVLESIAEKDPPFPRDVAPGVPEDLQAICLACLAREPAERPTAAVVATDLGRYLAGEPVHLRPALYGDVLRRSIARHVKELRDWERQRMISDVESDRLQLVYREILADEDHWIIDARRISLAQTVHYTSTWLVVVAAALLVWLVLENVAPSLRWLAPVIGTLGLQVMGFLAHRRREFLASASFLAGAILALAPTLLLILGELEILASRPAGVGQLMEPFSNYQILAASMIGLLLSVVVLWRLRMTGFAWTTALLGVTAHFSVLLILDLLGQDPEIQALWFLPLVLVEGLALLFERMGRVRWALPFHLVALVVLVSALDVIALEGPTLEMLGLAPRAPAGETVPFLDHERQRFFSLALNGVLFLVIMILAERARSLDLRRIGRLFEIVTPIHLLGALYANVEEHRRSDHVSVDLTIYFAAVILVLALGPWRGRWRFLLLGLIGIALGSYLLIDLDLVPRTGFAIGLGIAGLAVAVATYAYQVLKPRPRERSSGPRQG